MKVAFDENVPMAMVRLFQALSNEWQIRKLGLTIETAKDYTPQQGDLDYLRKNDVPWIRRFSKAGGKIIISGNAAMMSVPHERLALLEENMIVLFFENRWNNWRFFAKCALLMMWLPEIARKVKTTKPKTFWRIPSIWDENGKLRPQSTGDLKSEKSDRKHIARSKAKRAVEEAVKKAAKRLAEKQPDFHQLMEHTNADSTESSEAQATSDQKEGGKPA